MAGPGIAPHGTRYKPGRIPGHAAVDCSSRCPRQGRTIRRAAPGWETEERGAAAAGRLGARHGIHLSAFRCDRSTQLPARSVAPGGGRPRVALATNEPRRLLPARDSERSVADATLTHPGLHSVAALPTPAWGCTLMLNSSLSEAAPAVRRHALPDRRPERRGQQARVAGRRSTSPSSARLDLATCPSRRYELSGAIVESVRMLHHQQEHRARHVSPHPRRPQSGSSGPCPALHVRPARGDRSTGRSTSYTIHAPVEDRLELSRRRASYPPLRLKVYGRRADGSRSTAASIDLMIPAAPRPSAAGRTLASCGTRVLEGVDADTPDVTPRWWRREAWDYGRRQLLPEQAARRRARAARGGFHSPPAAPTKCGQAPAPKLVWPPTGSSSRRPAAPEDARARARAGDEVAHRHRRLSLVHRLGPRHDDQPRGADARDGPPSRGGLDPADVRAITCATA